MNNNITGAETHNIADTLEARIIIALVFIHRPDIFEQYEILMSSFHKIDRFPWIEICNPYLATQ